MKTDVVAVAPVSEAWLALALNALTSTSVKQRNRIAVDTGSVSTNLDRIHVFVSLDSLEMAERAQVRRLWRVMIRPVPGGIG